MTMCTLPLNLTDIFKTHKKMRWTLYSKFFYGWTFSVVPTAVLLALRELRGAEELVAILFRALFRIAKDTSHMN